MKLLFLKEYCPFFFAKEKSARCPKKKLSQPFLLQRKSLGKTCRAMPCMALESHVNWGFSCGTGNRCQLEPFAKKPFAETLQSRALRGHVGLCPTWSLGKTAVPEAQKPERASFSYFFNSAIISRLATIFPASLSFFTTFTIFPFMPNSFLIS